MALRAGADGGFGDGHCAHAPGVSEQQRWEGLGWLVLDRAVGSGWRGQNLGCFYGGPSPKGQWLTLSGSRPGGCLGAPCVLDTLGEGCLCTAGGCGARWRGVAVLGRLLRASVPIVRGLPPAVERPL